MAQIELTESILLYSLPHGQRARDVRDIRNTIMYARVAAQTKLVHLKKKL